MKGTDPELFSELPPSDMTRRHRELALRATGYGRGVPMSLKVWLATGDVTSDDKAPGVERVAQAIADAEERGRATQLGAGSSDPTAESGKDSAPPGSDVTPNSGGPVHVQGVITTTGGGGAVEPVAEAPERVTLEPLAWGTVEQEDGWWCIDTIDQDAAGVGPFASKALAQEECDRINAASGQVSHESAWGSVGLTIPPTDGTVRLLRRYIQQQKAQQEQSEREVAELRKLLLDARAVIARHLELSTSWDDERHSLRTQLTAAERKAEGLRVELEAKGAAFLRACEDAKAGPLAIELDRVNKRRAAEQHVYRRRITDQKTSLRQLHKAHDHRVAEVALLTRERQQLNELFGIQRNVSNSDPVGAVSALQAKLAESGRKLAKTIDGYRLLAEYFQETMNCATAQECIQRDCYRDARDMAQASFDEFSQSAPTESAGVEADCRCQQAPLGSSRCEDCGHDLGCPRHVAHVNQPDPTPTETEAPAMFRVGQRHLIAAHAVVELLQKNDRVSIEQIDGKDIIAGAIAAFAGEFERGVAAWEALAAWERGGINRAVTVEPVQDIFLLCAGDGDDGATGNGATATEAALSLCESIGLTLEPADPAPPKPGGEVLTVERLVKALEKLVNQGGIIRPDSPGSWFGKLAEELEREGGGKS